MISKYNWKHPYALTGRIQQRVHGQYHDLGAFDHVLNDDELVTAVPQIRNMWAVYNSVVQATEEGTGTSCSVIMGCTSMTSRMP